MATGGVARFDIDANRYQTSAQAPINNPVSGVPRSVFKQMVGLMNLAAGLDTVSSETFFPCQLAMAGGCVDP